MDPPTQTCLTISTNTPQFVRNFVYKQTYPFYFPVARNPTHVFQTQIQTTLFISAMPEYPLSVAMKRLTAIAMTRMFVLQRVVLPWGLQRCGDGAPFDGVGREQHMRSVVPDNLYCLIQMHPFWVMGVQRSSELRGSGQRLLTPKPLTLSVTICSRATWNLMSYFSILVVLDCCLAASMNRLSCVHVYP